ncbi:TonB-dependent siderophore receptor [Nitrosococcus oceani]|uniref:TonB-dependent siderophore receptor n=1 Tax=Nitrosococcus oceani TaxID=1229 RepID=UPI0004E92234|nr:TonB-dependent receptor plug domain-containing protein [Nitrosococcus oceani]KFI23878.1 hypothetical protein HW44_01765 [Nitrosococcus oceani]
MQEKLFPIALLSGTGNPLSMAGLILLLSAGTARAAGEEKAVLGIDLKSTVKVAQGEEVKEEGEVGRSELAPMTVTGQAMERSYAIPNSSTATKTDTPIMETPATINIVTEQSLRDRQTFSIGQAFEYTSGFVSMGIGGGPFDAGGIIRGFQNGIQGSDGGFYFRDGFRAFAIPISIANLERLELLKGPASVLYGQAEPGGIINAIYKKPLAQPYYALEQRFGSYDFYQTNVDATGPLTQDDTLLYRM